MRRVIIGLAAAAGLLSLGLGLLQRTNPPGGNPEATEASIGPDVSPVGGGEGDGRSEEAPGSSGQGAAGAKSQSSGIEQALPSDGLDRNTEYVVEDGLIVPQRIIRPGALSGDADSEPSVPEASPMDIPAAGEEEVTVPAGFAGPALDVPDQQVPGGHAAATRAPPSLPADPDEASARQVPRL